MTRRGGAILPRPVAWLTSARTPRSEWLRARRAGVGGSDVAAILGLSPFSSPWDVWAQKSGAVDDGPPSGGPTTWRNPHTPRSTVLPLGGRAGPGTPMEGRTGSGPEARGVPGRGDPREGGADLPGGPTPGLAPERSGLPGGGSPPAAGQTSRPHVTHNSDDDEGIPA